MFKQCLVLCMSLLLIGSGPTLAGRPLTAHEIQQPLQQSAGEWLKSADGWALCSPPNAQGIRQCFPIPKVVVEDIKGPAANGLSL